MFRIRLLKRNLGMLWLVVLLILVSCGVPEDQYGILLEDSTYVPDIREIEEPLWLANGNSVALPYGSFLIVRNGVHFFTVSLSRTERVVAVSIKQYRRVQDVFDLVNETSKEIKTRKIGIENPMNLSIDGTSLGELIDVNTILLERPGSYSWSPREITHSDLSELEWK